MENCKTQEFYLVTYCYDKENNNWKSNKFTNRDKALEYYTRMKERFDLIYFK